MIHLQKFLQGCCWSVWYRWRTGSPLQKILVRAIPTLLSVQICLALSANVPLMFHRLLRDEISHPKDTDLKADRPGSSKVGNWDSLLIEAVHSESCRTCHLLSDH